MTESEVPDMVRNLIVSFFILGYVDTTKAFQAEVSKEKRLVEGDRDDNMTVDENEDLDVVNRQKCVDTSLAEILDGAFECLREYYPQVLEEKDSLVVFKLECCKFIELVRAAIPKQDVEMVDADVVAVNGNGTSSENIPGTNNYRDNALITLVEYGQKLRNQYKSDKREKVWKRLSQCFSLMAYEDPRQDESVSFLLNEKERYVLAEEGNSQILVSLGKPPVPPLKRVAQHAMGFDLGITKPGPRDVDVLNVHQDFLNII